MDFLFRRTYRGPLRAVIADWAGTTVDFGCMAPAVVFIEIFKRRGVEITMDEAREPMGTNKKVHIRRITQMGRVAAAWRQAHGRAPGEPDVEALYKEFIPLQLKCIADYAGVIRGTHAAVGDIRRRGLRLGSTTGYSREMMDILVPAARSRGYEAESVVTADDVPAGRPAPWMALKSAMDLQVYPLEAVIKVGDTVPDVAEGLNAGMWTVAVVMTGNEIGLDEDALARLDPADRAARRAAAAAKLAQAGAHAVIDSIADLPAVLDELARRVASGEKP